MRALSGRLRFDLSLSGGLGTVAKEACLMNSHEQSGEGGNDCGSGGQTGRAESATSPWNRIPCPDPCETLPVMTVGDKPAATLLDPESIP